MQMKDYDREELIDQFVDRILQDIDANTMHDLLAGSLTEKFNNMGDNELEDQIVEFYPELLGK